MTHGVTFDCDGTLLDMIPLWRKTAVRYLSGPGIEVDKALGTKFFKMTVLELAQIIRDESNLDFTVEETITGIYETVAREYHDRVGLRPGVGELIKTLTRYGIPLVIASSDSEALIRPVLVRLGLEQNLMETLTSSETGLHERQPDMFLVAARFVGVKPEDIWAFEDALYAVRVAEAVGFYPVAIRDEASLAECGALEAEAEIHWEECPTEIPVARLC